MFINVYETTKQSLSHLDLISSLIGLRVVIRHIHINLFTYTVEIGVFCRRIFLPPRVIFPPCMPLFLHSTIYLENILYFFAYRFFCYLYHAKMYNLNVFSIGLFCHLNYLLYNVGSEAKLHVFWTEKANCLSFR